MISIETQPTLNISLMFVFCFTISIHLFNVLLISIFLIWSFQINLLPLPFDSSIEYHRREVSCSLLTLEPPYFLILPLVTAEEILQRSSMIPLPLYLELELQSPIHYVNKHFFWIPLPHQAQWAQDSNVPPLLPHQLLKDDTIS